MDFSIDKHAAAMVMKGMIQVQIIANKYGMTYQASTPDREDPDVVPGKLYDMEFLVTKLKPLLGTHNFLFGPNSLESKSQTYSSDGNKSVRFDKVTEHQRIKNELELKYPDQADFGLVAASNVIDKYKLNEAVHGGVKNQLASDSLTVHDMIRHPIQVLARSILVCHKLKSAKIVSRINTDRENLSVRGARDLQEWWEGSSSFQKWTVLTTASKAGNTSRIKCEKGTDPFRVLDKIRCPFPDPHLEVETAGSEDEDETSGFYKVEPRGVSLEL